MARTFTLPAADTVTFGQGAFDTVDAAVESLGGTRAFAVLSGSLRGGPVEDALRERLRGRLAGIYAGTRQHVPRGSVLEATELARAAGADCVISLGGGTPIDCAKGVALALSTGARRSEDLDRHRVRYTYPATVDVPVLEGDVVPHVAVPTTLSGGEHTELCGITDETTHAKDVYRSPKLQPRKVILDPWVAAGTPGWLWAASGIRAVDHAVEGILSTRHLAMTDAMGSAALRLLAANLARSAADPADADARTDCLTGTWLSIFGATNVGVGLSHGIGHQLAATFDIVHGVTSAIMLPRVMAFVAPAVGPRLRLVADSFGVDTRDLDDEQAAERAMAAVRDLVHSCSVPDRISLVGGERDLLDGIADRTMQDPTVASCPRPVSRQDVLGLLESAW